MACFTFFKCMMVLFNLLILLGGLTLLGVGIWVSVDKGLFLQVLSPFTLDVQYVKVGFFCIAIGGVLVLLGVLGCCGAHKGSKCLLLLFFSIILIIFIAEVAAGTVALAYSSFNQYGSDPVVTKIWNSTMTELNCCGFTNYTDFTDSYYSEQSEGSYPPSCCQLDTAPCSQQQAWHSAVQGCFEQLLEALQKHANIVGGIAVGIGGLEVAAMLVSMYLYCYLDNNVS
ncbi:tetraspanin-1 isoform X2 [Salmo salar]|uniref:Tetraspanin n=1 Tax=Salmo salar TaxID=8030 RepID=A0A1S3KK42_SALSA|nr:tetraspanin-1 isoform X2 [Salmo salar]|eukprot:XP_013978977.1 PREDICTED: tetraspanin-1 isoform X2 [Salmo salar]